MNEFKYVPVDELVMLNIISKSMSIPEIRECPDWPDMVLEILDDVMREADESNLSKNLCKTLYKKYGSSTQFGEGSMTLLAPLNIMKFLLELIPQAPAAPSKVYISTILFDYIFYQPNLYRNLLIYHSNIHMAIYDKLLEFSNHDGGKFRMYFAEYIIQHNKYRQNILLF